MEIPKLDREHGQSAADGDLQDPVPPPAGADVDSLFVHRRRLTFGDTDSARIIYTPRVAHFVIEAIEAWYLERLDISWLHINRDEGFGTPIVRLEMDFISMMRPPDLLDTEVAVEKMGRSSLGFRVTGRIGTRLCYRAACVSVFASADTGRSLPIPEHYRTIIARDVALAARAASADAAHGHT